VKIKNNWNEENDIFIEKRKSILYNNFPTRTSKEYIEDNAEIIAEKKKIYHEDNKGVISEKKKIYHANNKEVLAEKDEIYYENNKEVFSGKI
jgi:hypothetical protein